MQKRWLRREKTPPAPKSAQEPRRYRSRNTAEKGTAVRAEPIQLEGSEFGPPEEPPGQTDQPSLIELENAHLQAFINQLSLVNMRQVNQEEEANNQQMAAEQQTYVNEANAQMVVTNAALRRKWATEPDDE